MQSKRKRKAHRKALRESEAKAYRKKKLTIEKWLKNYYSTPDYVEKPKRMSWKQFKKSLKR